MGRRLGVVIGVNHYQDAAFRPLRFAETDARILSQWLVNVQGGNWAPADIQLALGVQATRELAESLIMQTCLTIAEPGDLVLIYIAGHAFLDETSGEGYLALANTYYQQPTTGLHIPSLMRQAMAGSRASSIIFILDSFQTGAMWSRLRTSAYDAKPLLGTSLLNTLQQVGNRLILCSCRGNELLAELGEKNVGSLAYHLIVGLSGKASDPASGRVTLQQLSAFLSTTLNEQHRPQLFGQESYPAIVVGEMLSPTMLANVGAPSIAPTSSPFAPASVLAPASPTPAPLPFARPASLQFSPTTSGLHPLAGTDPQRQQQSMLLLNQARQLVQMQNTAEALPLVEQALAFLPTNIDALILKGQLLGATGRYQEALLVVESLVQLTPNSALVWSMRAVLLTNLGQYQEALQAIDRSLALDPNNAETHVVKDNIQSQLARIAYLRQSQLATAGDAAQKKRGGPASFFLSAGLQVFALFIGAVGAALPVIVPQVPILLAFGMESIGLAVLCVNAVRGTYLYGFMRLLLTLLVSAAAAGIVGAIYKFAYPHVQAAVRAHPPTISLSTVLSILFLGLWLAAAAIVPLALALGGFIGWLIRLLMRMSRKTVGA